MALAGGKFAVADEFWSAFRLHPQSITGSKESAKLVRESLLEMLSQVKGRQPQKYDKVLTFGHGILRHVLNPLDTWERIRRGPVYGRSLDNQILRCSGSFSGTSSERSEEGRDHE